MSPKNTRKVRDRSAQSDHDKSFAEAYKKHAGEISILTGTFFLRYLGEVYRKFNGDLA